MTWEQAADDMSASCIAGSSKNHGHRNDHNLEKWVECRRAPMERAGECRPTPGLGRWFRLPESPRWPPAWLFASAWHILQVPKSARCRLFIFFIGILLGLGP